MAEPAEFASRLISAGAAGYAAGAAERLLELHPETAARFGASAFADWQAHLQQRLEELAAALLAGEPELFVSEVLWSRRAFEVREVPAADLRASLESLRATLAEELPAAAGGEPVRFVELGLAALEREPAAEEERPPDAADETTRLGLAYLEAALEGDRRRAVDVLLSAVDDGLAIPEAFAALSFAQAQVGKMWHAWQVGIAQEHFVTDTTRSLLVLLTERAEKAPANGKTVIVASAPGNAHDIGTRIVAARFEIAGWRAIHLGAGLPAGDLALGAEVFAADLLALSMSLPTQLRATMEAVVKARAARPGLKILAGGRALFLAPRLCERLGADACGASADEALALGAGLVGLAPDPS